MFIYLFLCVWVFCWHVYKGTTWVQCPRSPRQSIGLPRTGLTGDHEALWGVLVPELLGEQPMFFTTEPSLRPRKPLLTSLRLSGKRFPPKLLSSFLYLTTSLLLSSLPTATLNLVLTRMFDRRHSSELTRTLYTDHLVQISLKLCGAWGPIPFHSNPNPERLGDSR